MMERKKDRKKKIQKERRNKVKKDTQKDRKIKKERKKGRKTSALLGYRCFQIGFVFVEYDLFNTTNLTQNKQINKKINEKIKNKQIKKQIYKYKDIVSKPYPQKQRNNPDKIKFG